MRRLPIYRLLLFGVSCLAPAHAASDGVQPADTTALFRYERAYDEMAAMLDSSDSVCLKRAVFLPEWAYVGDELNYNIYCARLDTMAAALRAFIAANRLDDAPIGAHIALFEFFVRPYAMNGYKPFDYEFEDCDGEVDFTNTFVTKLMRTHSGQCRSLPLLYKLLANEIGAEAYIAYAPCHTFVRHRDETGEGWINVELTSRNLPRDEFIITPAMARTIFTCGGVMVLALLGMLFGWTFSEEGMTVRRLTLFFSTFVFFQFWNMFNAKGFETRHSVFTCLKGCREFFLILLAIAVGQVLIVELGGEVFRTVPLTWREWAEVICLTSLLAAGGEAVRALRRRKNA